MNYTSLVIRILVVLLTFVLPWWLVLVISAVALAVFPFFVEIVLIGLILDYLAGSQIFFPEVPYLFTLITTVAFVITYSIKRKILV